MAIYRKRRSKCEYSYTIAKAIGDLAGYLSCKVNVVKIGRCSDQGAKAADALSKGDWDRAWRNMPNKDDDPKRVPRVLLRWLNNPHPDMELGEKIVDEMSQYTEMLYEK